MNIANLFRPDEVKEVQALEQEWAEMVSNGGLCEVNDTSDWPDADEVDLEQLEHDYRQTFWNDEDWARYHEYESFDPEKPVCELNEVPCAKTEPLPTPVLSPPLPVVVRPEFIRSRENSGIISAARLSAKERATITPYDAAQIMIQQVPMVYANNRWFLFQKSYYAEATAEDVKRCIMDFWREEISKNGRADLIDQILKVLKNEPRIYEKLDFNQNFVALDDMVVDLDHWQLITPAPQIFVTTHICASFARGEQSDCPNFKRLLHDISCGDAVLQKRIWQMIGYILVPDQAGKAFFLLQGRKHSGKSVLGEFISRCFDEQMVVSITINDFDKRFALSALYGKRLCTDFDLPANPFGETAVSYLKKMTGSDLVSSDVKFGDRINFKNSAKFLFATNHAAVLPNADDAFFDRLVVIPFAYSIPSEQRDRCLGEKLNSECDAIVIQALAAYRELVADHYRFAGDFKPNEVIEDGNDNIIDAVAGFLCKYCVLQSDAWIPTADLHQAFCRLCGNLCGDKYFSETLLKVAKSLEFPIEKKRSRITPSANPVYGFAGLNLKEKI